MYGIKLNYYVLAYNLCFYIQFFTDSKVDFNCLIQVKIIRSILGNVIS